MTGIFRVSGLQTDVLELKAKFNDGEVPMEKLRQVDVHVLASLLKMYFREIEAVTTYDNYVPLMNIASMTHDTCRMMY